jgi:hypothetical protein
MQDFKVMLGVKFFPIMHRLQSNAVLSFGASVQDQNIHVVSSENLNVKMNLLYNKEQNNSIDKNRFSKKVAKRIEICYNDIKRTDLSIYVTNGGLI